MRRVTALAVFAVLLTGCAKNAPAPLPGAALAPSGLHSPWDMQQVPPTNAPYNCGPIIPLASNISILNDNYRNNGNTAASESVKAAAYGESSAAIADLAARVTSAADAFQHNGSSQAAQCALTLLASAASDHAMAGWMSSKDAIHEQTKGLRSVTIAYLKVRNSGALTAEEQSLILSWFQDIAHSQRDYYDHLECAVHAQHKVGCDYHNLWGSSAAYAVASVGIATNDHGLFYWGLHGYRHAVEAIQPTGFIRSDLDGQWAVKCTLESAAALVQLAEYGELNGEPLYAYDGGHLHLLVHVATRGLVDPTPFQDAARARQKLPSTIEGWQIGWATLYNRRFPDSVITGLLQQSSDAGLYAWGGEPFGEN